MPCVDVSENDPGRVDLSIRAAIHLCWHALPKDQQNLDVVERHFRRLVDRTFGNLRKDAELFVKTIIDGEILEDGHEI